MFFLNFSEGPGTYKVIKCGASGHNIRARPSLKASPIGMITKGKKIKAVEDVSSLIPNENSKTYY